MDVEGIKLFSRGWKMKILQVGPVPPEVGGKTVGGVARVLWELSQNLSKMGHQVTIIATNPAFNRPTYVGDIKLYPLSRRFLLKNAFYISNLDFRGLKFYSMMLPLLKPFYGRIKPYFIYNGIRKVISLENPDIIHVHHLDFMIPFVYYSVKSIGKDTPIVSTLHSIHAFEKMRSVGKYNDFVELVIDNLNMINTIIAVSGDTLNKLKRLLDIEILPVDALIIPNGFNFQKISQIDKIHARNTLKLPLNSKIIFSLGNLIERKGFHYLIDAISMVIGNRKDIICFIGGTGPLRDELQKQIERLRLTEHVKLLGYIPDNDLALWMNAADLFVLPSLSEGNPTVMFEALGVGLPFVGTVVGGVSEIIVSEDYGLLCPPADPECLAEKILIALEKEWDRKKIREYAQQFTWEKITKRILKIYKLLGGYK